ncbi:MAG: hypothetical protein ACKV2V_08715 [Blastocatellia bacterium]
MNNPEKQARSVHAPSASSTTSEHRSVIAPALRQRVRQTVSASTTTSPKSRLAKADVTKVEALRQAQIRLLRGELPVTGEIRAARSIVHEEDKTANLPKFIANFVSARPVVVGRRQTVDGSFCSMSDAPIHKPQY